MLVPYTRHCVDKVSLRLHFVNFWLDSSLENIHGEATDHDPIFVEIVAVKFSWLAACWTSQTLWITILTKWKKNGGMIFPLKCIQNLSFVDSLGETWHFQDSHPARCAFIQPCIWMVHFDVWRWIQPTWKVRSSWTKTTLDKLEIAGLWCLHK